MILVESSATLPYKFDIKVRLGLECHIVKYIVYWGERFGVSPTLSTYGKLSLSPIIFVNPFMI